MPTLQPPKIDTSMSTSSLTLTSTNYRHWAMRIEVTLEAHNSWGAIDRTEKNYEKDCLALSMILNPILESQSSQIDIKKSAKETLEILGTLYM